MGTATNNIAIVLHDLVLDIDGQLSALDIANFAEQAIHKIAQGSVAVWWAGDNADYECIYGAVPSSMQILPAKIPAHLCMIKNGSLITLDFFEITPVGDWVFAPITDRQAVFGWIGINVCGQPIVEDFTELICTIGAVLGKSHQQKSLEKENIENAKRISRLARYLSPAMAKAVTADTFREQCVQKVTVLFFDLRGFTSRIDQQNHMDLLREINTFFALATDIIFSHHGIVDKLIGDGLLAEFGLLDNEPTEPAKRAFLAATELIEMTKFFNMQHNPVTPYRINIGIATGDVHFGHVGGQNFFDLTVIGKPVNLASRLESKCQELKVDILVDMESYLQLPKSSRWTTFESVQLKGISAPVPLRGYSVNT